METENLMKLADLCDIRLRRVGDIPDEHKSRRLRNADDDDYIDILSKDIWDPSSDKTPSWQEQAVLEALSEKLGWGDFMKYLQEIVIEESDNVTEETLELSRIQQSWLQWDIFRASPDQKCRAAIKTLEEAEE